MKFHHVLDACTYKAFYDGLVRGLCVWFGELLGSWLGGDRRWWRLRKLVDDAVKGCFTGTGAVTQALGKVEVRGSAELS